METLISFKCWVPGYEDTPVFMEVRPNRTLEEVMRYVAYRVGLQHPAAADMWFDVVGEWLPEGLSVLNSHRTNHRLMQVFECPLLVELEYALYPKVKDYEIVDVRGMDHIDLLGGKDTDWSQLVHEEIARQLK